MAPKSSEILGTRGLDITGMGWALLEDWDIPWGHPIWGYVGFSSVDFRF